MTFKHDTSMTTNVFQSAFPPQQASGIQTNPQNADFGVAHARMHGKRQRSASPNSNGDESMFGHQQKRNKPFWTAAPKLAGQSNPGHHVQNLTGTQGFFDFTKSTIADPSSQQHMSHYQFAQNPYPFPFPSPNNLSPSGLVLPDSTMSSNSIFAPGQGFVSANPNIAARATEANQSLAPHLQRENSHGSYSSLQELRARMASSGLREYKDLPSVMDDNDTANDGDDEMLISDSVMHTMHIGPDSTMDVSVPRPPRNSFSSMAHAGEDMGQGALGKPLAIMLSDRFAQTTSNALMHDAEKQDASKRSNASDGLGAAEQYFVDGMRGVEQQHKDWSSPTESNTPEGQQQLRYGGDVDMNGAPAVNGYSHPAHAHTSIEHAQANLHQHRQEQHRQQHNHVESSNDCRWTGSTLQVNGYTSIAPSYQHPIHVPNSTQSIHNRQKFTLGPRPDCSKCLAGSSGHAGHWM